MIALVVKATVVLAAALSAAASLRRGPAALRHFIWTAALAAILLLPLLSFAPPAETVATPAIVVSAISQAAAPMPDPVPGRSLPWLAIAYAAGVLAAAARFGIGAWRVSGLVRRGSASPIGDDLGLRVILSAGAPMPLAWGIRRPVVLLPAAATSWPATRLRSVLLHEAMHHRRRDLLAQAVAQAACCIYWFHPLAWLALERQRAERERACDDAVLAQGIPAHDYASHLVEVVRSVAAARRGWSGAPAMAEASGLESRVRAVLNSRADRNPLSRRAAAGVAAAALLLLAPLSIVGVRAQGATTIAGVVEDPSGARVPKCKVTARNLDGPNIEVAVADMAGEYRFVNIPSGRYEIEFGAPGFKRLKLSTTVVAGATARVDGRLDIGEVSETLAVRAPRMAPAVQPAPAAAPRRIPVGGNVQSTRLIRQPRPEYPPELRQAGVEGTVVIRAVISKEGAVLNPQVVNSADPRLVKPALDAVSKWRYEPTLLNGQPVETVTTISLEFQLGQ